VDTLVTVTIVGAAALWAALRLFRRRPGACDGACSGCPGGGREAARDACSPEPSSLSLPTRNDGRR
jgi:hypothetical protein